MVILTSLVHVFFPGFELPWAKVVTLQQVRILSLFVQKQIWLYIAASSTLLTVYITSVAKDPNAVDTHNCYTFRTSAFAVTNLGGIHLKDTPYGRSRKTPNPTHFRVAYNYVECGWLEANTNWQHHKISSLNLKLVFWDVSICVGPE